MSATPDPSKMTRAEKIAHTEKLIKWNATLRVEYTKATSSVQCESLKEDLLDSQDELTEWLEQIIPADPEQPAHIWDRDGDEWFRLSNGDYAADDMYSRPLHDVGLRYGPLYLDPERTLRYTSPTEGENK